MFGRRENPMKVRGRWRRWGRRKGTFDGWVVIFELSGREE